ncbi:nuclear transport factor 2 family protein [Haladaptatus sp. F3-133]|uniref:Nuclear transport factor 2 family protein n=1 Tax=Halorutilus salinus TaxID=2487751 RepID=A0A9Q4GGF8_9EURY|nr:nuclear transport factor 2 family protein [Halorutilus salinus]MCX2819109.1 nuclear transport factor 2 family protein [Halorutilus salinus]
MDAEQRIESYYESLRNGETLPPYFADDADLVKYGISERLDGYEEVSEGLRSQTRSTEGWTVESEDLRVTERDGGYAWFTDSVRMAWTDNEKEKGYDFDSRWSGSLENRDGWVFVSMHVSVGWDG